MKNKIVLVLSAATAIGVLAACNVGFEFPTTFTAPTVNLVDSRVADAYTLVKGEYVGRTFESYDDDETYPSLYEAVGELLENCDYGSYVYRTNSESKMSMFTNLQMDNDLWFYYKDGSMLDGSYIYDAGDPEWYKGENYTRIMSSRGTPKPTYQPYCLKGHESKGTNSWNRLPLLDAAARYNPQAFTGIQDTTYTFNLSQAKIRPSYNPNQKVVPMVTLSTTDSYNWSNQGIYMDTDTGFWYYLNGETQSDVKSLEYYTNTILFDSTWNEANQEFTPNYDVKFTFASVENEEDGSTYNTLKIDVLKDGEVVKTYNESYEFTQMTMRGTHRAQAALDLIPDGEDAEDVDEAAMSPDFMCGAYFKNIVVSEAKGSVREDLTDEIYDGDADMCCEAGQTYDLLIAKEGYKNDANTEVIMDNLGCVSFDDSKVAEGKDIWNISYDQKISSADRSTEILECEELIDAIPDEAEEDDIEVLSAYYAFEELSIDKQFLITDIDGHKKLANIMGE